MKGNGIVAVVMAMVLAVSACALPEQQDHQNAAATDLSNSASPSSDPDSGPIVAQTSVSVSENYVTEGTVAGTVLPDQSINVLPRHDSEPGRIEAQANVPVPKKDRIGKKAGKPAVSVPPTPPTPRDQYFTSLFSITVDDPQWTHEIGQCATATYARHMSILKKGMEREIAAAASKTEAEEMRAILGQLDDPLLFKANCIKNLIVMMYGTNNLQAVAPKPAQVRQKEQAVEWTFPIKEVRAHRKDLSEKALTAVRKKFYDSFAGPSLATDAMYPYVKELWMAARKSFKEDFNYFSKPGGEAATLAGPALFHRGIYIKLASSKKYSAGVARVSRAVGAKSHKSNPELHPAKKKS